MADPSQETPTLSPPSPRSEEQLTAAAEEFALSFGSNVGSQPNPEAPQQRGNSASVTNSATSTQDEPTLSPPDDSAPEQRTAASADFAAALQSPLESPNQPVATNTEPNSASDPNSGTQDVPTLSPPDDSSPEEPTAASADFAAASLSSLESQAQPAATNTQASSVSDPNSANDNLLSIEQAFLGAFPATEDIWYETMADLKNRVNELAGSFGFCVSSHGSKIKCTRAAMAESTKKRLAKASAKVDIAKKRKRSSSRCGCLWQLSFTPLSRPLRERFPDATEKAVRITKASYLHTNGCAPSKQQLIQQKKSSGQYSKEKFTRERLSNLIAAGRCGYLSASMIRNFLTPLLPPNVAVNAMMIANVRIRVNRFIEKEDVDAQISTDDANSLLKGALEDVEKDRLSLDCEPEDYFAMSVAERRKILRDALRDGNDAQQMKSFLDSKMKHPSSKGGFSYRISYSDDGHVVGFVWQDAVMRFNFERFGSTIFLDSMKRQTNILFWPYIAVVGVDGYGKVVVFCEAFVCTESHDAYAFVVDSLWQMTPNALRSFTKVIFADGIMRDSFLALVGIQFTCRIVWDLFHLRNDNWPKQFGPFLYRKWSNLFDKMVFSFTEEDFEENYRILYETIVSETGAKHVDYLSNQVYSNRKHFVKFWVNSYEATLGFQGDSLAESNHSSWCSRIGKQSSVTLAEACSLAIQRQEDIQKERQEHYYHHASDAATEACCRVECPERKKAVRFLSSKGLERYDHVAAEARNYDLGSPDENGCCQVSRRGTSAPPRVVGPNLRCTCNDAKAYPEAPCVHEFRYDGMLFVTSRFGRRYHQMSGLGYSYKTASAFVPMEEATIEATAASQTQDTLTQEEDGCFLDLDDDAQDMIDRIDQRQFRLPSQENQSPNRGVAEPAPKKRRVDEMRYGKLMDLCKNWIQSVYNHPRQDLFIGLMVKSTESAANKSYDPYESLESVFKRHMESFNYAKKKPFSQTGAPAEGGEIVLQPLQPRAAMQTGRPQQKRLVSHAEAALNGCKNSKKRPANCSFCGMTGHKVTSCNKIQSMGVKPLSKKDRDELALHLGEPAVHRLESLPVTDEMMDYLSKYKFELSILPPNAKHLVLERAWVDPSSRRQHGLKANTNYHYNPGRTIIEVTFLDAAATPIEVNGERLWFRAEQVRLILVNTKIKNVLNKLQHPAKTRAGDYFFPTF